MRSACKPITVVFAVLGLAFPAAPALAGQGYENVTSKFGEAGSGPGQFKEPTAIAVNDETEHVYVLDSGNDRVEAFNEKHEFQFAFDGSGKDLAVEGKEAGSGGLPGEIKTGKFLKPGGIAVDNDPSSASYGDVYVADIGPGHEVVDRFSATGEYLGQIAGTSGTGEGTLTENSTRIENVTGAFIPGQEITGTGIPSGTTITSLPEPGVLEISQAADATTGTPVLLTAHGAFVGMLNMTTDAAGDLWVYESNGPILQHERAPQVDELSDTGGAITTFAVEMGGQPEFPGLAVDSSGDVYIGGSELYEFPTPSRGRITIARPGPLAIIAANNDLLLDEGSTIALYKAGALGSPLFTFPSTGLSESGGIAVNGGKGEGTIYATQRKEDDVDVFESGKPEAPEIVSESASTVNEAQYGQFAAMINPGNRETTYTFEYAASEAAVLNGEGTLAAGETTIPAEFGNQDVTSPVVELSPYDETFYYRVVAENELSNGKPIVGPVQAYTKLPLVGNEKFSSLTSTGAKLEATVNPVFIESTKYAFEYATSEELLEEGKGTLAPNPAAKLTEAGNEPFPVSAEVTGLQPGQPYFYRVIAKNEISNNRANANEGKPVHGEIKEFTPYAPPVPTTGAAQNITGTAATLSGEVNPERTEAKYYFQYIANAAYEKAEKGDAQEKANPYAEGETTTPIAIPAGDIPQATAQIPVSGLLPEETYDYALVAINKFELREVGENHTFTTSAATPPVVTTGAVSNVSQNSATLTGTVSTSGLQTEYGFEIGTGPGNYGPVTGLGSIGGATTEAVSLTLGELQPGTTYYYRVTASSVDGATHGEPVSFTTPGFPTLIAPPASPPLITSPAIAFPKEEKPSETTVKTLTSKEKLANALKACKKDKSKSKRQSCEKQAKKKYPVAKAKKKKEKGGKK